MIELTDKQLIGAFEYLAMMHTWEDIYPSMPLEKCPPQGIKGRELYKTPSWIKCFVLLEQGCW